MNSVEKLNNLIKSIESSKHQRKRENTTINFDDMSFDNLDIEFIVGSKVNIQTENKKLNDKTLSLEKYLKSISEYKKNQKKFPKYRLQTDDLTLDIDLEIDQKYLLETPIRISKTPEDIKRDISITLLENLKTSIFLYKNLDKKARYKATFDDLTLDINLDVSIKSKSIEEVKEVKERLVNSNDLNKIKFLKEKLLNIEKIRQEKHYKREQKSNIDIGVTLTKSGKKLISLSKQNKINKLKEILDSINSYREKRDGLYK